MSTKINHDLAVAWASGDCVLSYEIAANAICSYYIPCRHTLKSCNHLATLTDMLGLLTKNYLRHFISIIILFIFILDHRVAHAVHFNIVSNDLAVITGS